MRIGLMIYGSLDTLSGGYLYDRRVVEHLRARGHTVEVVSQTGGSLLHKLGENASARLRDKLVELKPDVVLQDELNHPSLFLFNHRLSGALGAPIVTIIHALHSRSWAPWPERRLHRALEKRYLRSVDGYIGVSERTVRQAARLVPDEKPTLVAYPAGDRVGAGATEDEIADRCTGGGPLRVLYVGNLTRNKQLDRVLEAMAALPADVELTVVGDTNDGRYRQELRDYARANGLDARVRWIGRLDRGDALPQHFRSAHVLVLVSRAEGFPLVIPEAAGFGVPSIATTQSAANEFIDHGKTGFLCDPDDVASLRAHLSSLHRDRARLRTISLACRERFSRHPRWTDTGDAVEAFLQRMCARAPYGERT